MLKGKESKMDISQSLHGIKHNPNIPTEDEKRSALQTIIKKKGYANHPIKKEGDNHGKSNS